MHVLLILTVVDCINERSRGWGVCERKDGG